MDLKRSHSYILSFYRQETWGPGRWNDLPKIPQWVCDRAGNRNLGHLRNFTLKEITWLGQGHALSKVGTDGISVNVFLTPKATQFLWLHSAALQLIRHYLITKVVHVKLWQYRRMLSETWVPFPLNNPIPHSTPKIPVFPFLEGKY